MLATLPAPSDNLASWAEVVGGFATLIATIAAFIVIPVAYLEARRTQSIARLERISAAVNSYLEPRRQFYDQGEIRNQKLDDEFEDTFQNYYSVPQVDNMIAGVGFTTELLKEIDNSWADYHPSVKGIIDRDTRHLDGYLTVEAVSTYIADNACAVALAGEPLEGLDAYKIYSWDDVDRFERDIGFPSRSYQHPQLSDEAWETYRGSEEYLVRTKRTLLDAVRHRRSRRQELRQLVDQIDRIRRELGLPALFRHPEDMVEPAHAHG